MLTLRLDSLYISEITWRGCIVSGYEVVKTEQSTRVWQCGDNLRKSLTQKKSTREAQHPSPFPHTQHRLLLLCLNSTCSGLSQAGLQGKCTLNIRVTIHCDVQSCTEPEELLVEGTAPGSACNSSLWRSELHGTWEAAGGGNSPGLFKTQAHLSVLARVGCDPASTASAG